jgi:hypothetical protein
MKEQLKYLAILICAALLGHFIAYKLVHIPQRIELVVIISMLMFYPVLRRPIIGLYAVFIISPFIPYIRRLYYLSYERPSVDPLIILGDLFLAFILLGLFFEFRERRSQEQPSPKIVMVIFIYFIYLCIRTSLFNILPLGEALAKFKYYGPPVLFFFVGTIYADEPHHLKRFWYITIIIGILASLYGFHQLYNGYSKAEMLWFSSIEFSTLFIKGVARPFSIFQAPVALADYVQLAIIGILMCFAWSKDRAPLFLLLVIPVLLYAALVTSVRSSWIGIIATFCIWPLFFRIKGNGRRLAVMLLVVVSYVVYQYVTETFQSGFTLKSGVNVLTGSFSNQQYFDLLVANRATALYNPLGEHSFISRLMLWRSLLIYSLEPIHAFVGRGLGTLKADSLYFTYLAEFGYPGMFFIIAIIIIFIARGLYVIDHSTDETAIVLAKGIAILNIIFAIVSITGTHIHYFPGDIYFWFWNGVLIHLAHTTKATRAHTVSEGTDKPAEAVS